jgi:alpha-ketoglutarate-dependent taurine dioxygenase
MEPALRDDHLVIEQVVGPSRFHYVWLRDNCPCPECRIVSTGERRLFTADIPDTIAPEEARIDDLGNLDVSWNDGHRSVFSRGWLERHDYSRSPGVGEAHPAAVLWDRDLVLPRFDHASVVGSDEGQLAYLDALLTYGVAVVGSVPTIPGEAERFAQSIGHARELAFERVHNVRHDPAGYNAAHTSGELKPHTDFPSYHWPPSVQLLHFLTNRSTGGESVLVDGWRVLEDLREEDPEAFGTLTNVPVSFQMFSETEDTSATAPLIQCDVHGNVTTFRFSNQLALPLQAPFERVAPFYRAYRKLGRMVDDDRYKVVFRTVDGDLITVYGHRVLHGRLAYDPTSGARHLQDVYMEWDDLMARRRVLRGEHQPPSAQPAPVAS